MGPAHLFQRTGQRQICCVSRSMNLTFDRLSVCVFDSGLTAWSLDRYEIVFE